MKFGSFNGLAFGLVSLLAVSALGISGCNGGLLDKVEFSAEPNLETVKVQLDFSSDLQTDLGGSFEVETGGRDYGAIEVEPSGPGNPFNVGFRLNLNIVNEQDYVSLKPVTDLPSGQPIPIPNLNRAFAKVQMKNEINKNFDIYAYVDVAGKEWLGLAMTLKFINNKYFPAGLSVSKGFVKDKSGNNAVYGAVFGPKVDNSGNMTVPGGIALFGNAKALIELAGGKAMNGESNGSKFYLFQGPQAAYYQKNERNAFSVGQAFKQILNANSYGHALK
ncbi:MAG: hypothetical protein HY075_13165 [Deltaproteobacteria bacterium]|nr:hypothetical protein [Deltaproteobacteria bacterium]